MIFPPMLKGVAIPYGIYDFCRNEGFVNLGTSRDTAEFAVASIRCWWQNDRFGKYPNADHLLILADCGGSNGYRTRLWKHQLQVAFADRFKLVSRCAIILQGLQNGTRSSTACFPLSAITGQPIL
jgi:hypothetical protein